MTPRDLVIEHMIERRRFNRDAQDRDAMGAPRLLPPYRIDLVTGRRTYRVPCGWRHDTADLCGPFGRTMP